MHACMVFSAITQCTDLRITLPCRECCSNIHPPPPAFGHPHARHTCCQTGLPPRWPLCQTTHPRSQPAVAKSCASSRTRPGLQFRCLPAHPTRQATLCPCVSCWSLPLTWRQTALTLLLTRTLCRYLPCSIQSADTRPSHPPNKATHQRRVSLPCAVNILSIVARLLITHPGSLRTWIRGPFRPSRFVTYRHCGKLARDAPQQGCCAQNLPVERDMFLSTTFLPGCHIQ